ncbi:hypothetical protein A2U01_0094963, partial [Trifolium medium]|nr:hypothetical protein [Trifolium medium]
FGCGLVHQHHLPCGGGCWFSQWTTACWFPSSISTLFF